MATAKHRQSDTRQFTPLLIAGIVVVGLAILFLALRSAKPGQPQPTIVPAASLGVPESSDSAKAYIDRASAEADKPDYQQAIRILEQGLQKFPNDANLTLTKQYYENELQRHGQ